MTEAQIREILESLAAGRLSVGSALTRLRHLPFEDLGFAKFDRHRGLRRGIPEVVLGEGKTAEQIAAIGKRLIDTGDNFIVSRLSVDKAREVKRKLPALVYHADARVGAVIAKPDEVAGHGTVMVISAGTSDMEVAEEAAVCAEVFGNKGD